MSYLLDTNVAWRRFDTTDSRYADIQAAIDAILSNGDQVYVTAQNLIEFRNVATRPVTANGLGFTAAQATAKIQQIEAHFPMLPDTAAIYPHWRILVDRYAVIGKQVHDTRLVAVMLAHGVTHLLTLNPKDFRRFVEITVVVP